MRDSRSKVVSQINVPFGGNNSLNLPEVGFPRAPCRETHRNGQDDTKREDFGNVHLALLKHLQLRDQYVRITSNKSPFCPNDHSCRCHTLTLSTARPGSKSREETHRA